MIDLIVGLFLGYAARMFISDWIILWAGIGFIAIEVLFPRKRP